MNTLNLSRKLAARSCAGCYLLVLAGLLATVAPLRADNPPTYLFQLGSFGSGNGQLYSPVGIAIDSSNNVYVADNSNSRVEKFDSSGNYLTQWGSYGTGNGQFSGPEGVAVDSSNNVYVTDNHNNCVEKFDSNGNYLTQWGSYGTGNGQLYSPVGIAIDSSNNVYVADNNNSRVEKFDSSGNYLTQWGSLGTGNGQFNNPHGVAIDSSNNIYVTDETIPGGSNNRVEKFDSNGNYLTKWGSYGYGNGQFNGPNDVVVDSSNNVYVTDNNNNRVEKFDSKGNYLTQWNIQGSYGNPYYGLFAIAVDRSGNFIYVSDPYGRIDVFANNTNIIPPIITNQPVSQTVLGGVNLTFGVGVVGTAPFAYQWASNSVVLPGATNATLTLTNVSPSANGTYSVLVTNSFGTTFSRNAVLTVVPLIVETEPQPPSQTVLAGAIATFTVSVLSTSPVFYQWQFDYTNLPSATNVTLVFTNVALLNAGIYSVLISNSFGSVLSSNAVLTVIPAYVTTLPASGISTTGAVLNGSVTVAEDTVAWFDWGRDANYGNLVGTTVVPTGSNNLSVPFNGISGTFYHYRVVATNGAGIVYGNDQKFGVGVWVPPTYLFEIDSSAVSGGFEPRFIGLDQAGKIYASDGQSNRVVKLDGGGSYLTSWGSFGTNNGRFNFPFGVAIDSSNNVYVADSDNFRIEKFDSNGNYLSQWGSAGTSNGQFEYPSGIAVDSSNNVYVADGNNFRIEKFDTTGNYMSQWGSAGTGNGQFEYPAGIAIDSNNNIYVADDNNNRIEKFDSLGNYLTQWGSYGTGNSQFHYTVGIAVDNSNNVYVSDAGNNRIEKFDSNGNYLTQWGSAGSGNGQFNDPNGIAVKGNLIYVADYYNHRIQVFVNNINTVPPLIRQQPASQIVESGTNVTFSIGVLGTAPFAYQWNSNSVPVLDATNATFTLTNVIPSDAAAYSVLITNSFGSVLSSDAVLTIQVGTRPTAATLAATGMTTNSVVLNATVDAEGSDTTVWFKWGNTTNYGNQTPATDIGSGAASLNFSNVLAAVSLNTNYHCQVVASNSLGQATGGDVTFRLGAPFAVTEPATLVTGTNAWINGLVTPNLLGTIAWFEWGTNTSYGSTIPLGDVGSGGSGSPVSAFLSGLDPSLTYHFRLAATNSVGIAFGADTQISTSLYAYSQSVLEDQPLLYYHFDEASGAIAFNSGNLGAAANGTYNATVSLGNPSLVPPFGYSAGFNNSNSAVAVPALGNYSQLTIETWARPHTFGVAGPGNPHTQYNSIYTDDTWATGALHTHIINKGLPFHEWELAIAGNNPVQFDVGNSGLLPSNSWVHLAATYDSAARTLITYVNGHPLSTNVFTTALPVNLTAAHIGAWIGTGSTANWFDGGLDEFAIYGTVLPASRIQTHYQAAIGNPVLMAVQTTNKLALSWIGPGFKLQRNANLSNPADWTSVAGGSNSPVSVTISNSGNQFFRLRWP